MATWTVIVPMCGSVTVEVEADTEEEAINKAFDNASIDDYPSSSYEFHRKIVSGNVFHGEINEVEAIKEDF